MRARVDARDVVTLSPSTVAAVAQGRTVLHRPRRRGTAGTPTPPVVPTVSRRAVHPLVMAAALQAAGGDSSRLHFRADGSVVITNRSRPGVDKSAPR